MAWRSAPGWPARSRSCCAGDPPFGWRGCVLVQFGHTILLTDLVALRGWSAALFPLLIIAMALAQLLYARWLGARGTLR
jgi:hypothetical protein